MIVFDQLRVTNDGLHLVIDAHVSKEKYFDNIYMSKIYVLNEEQYKEGIGVTELESNYIPVWKASTTDVKEVSIIVDEEIPFDLKKSLLFVYVVTTGTPDSCTPCGLDNNPEMAVTMYMGDIYNQFMTYIKSIGDDCNIPQEFIDFLLKLKAIKLSMDSGHYTQGIQYYNKWLKGNIINLSSISNCGCHGR